MNQDGRPPVTPAFAAAGSAKVHVCRLRFGFKVAYMPLAESFQHTSACRQTKMRISGLLRLPQGVKCRNSFEKSWVRIPNNLNFIGVLRTHVSDDASGWPPGRPGAVYFKRKVTLHCRHHEKVWPRTL
jgi:hypothetical protein